MVSVPSATPRVLFSIPTLGKGGAEMQVRALAPRLAKQGTKVGLFTRLSNLDLQELRDRKVEVLPVTAGNHSPQLLKQALQAIYGFQPDIVYSWINQSDLLFGVLHRIRPSWRWVMAERSLAGAYRKGLKAALRTRLGWHADGIIANSVAGAEMWKGHRRVATIANGIDCERFSMAEPAETGVSSAPIVSVCRLIPTKRVDLLIDAFALVREQCPLAVLLIVGDGPERPVLEAQVAGLGLCAAVRFVGLRSDVPRWFRAAAVVVSASELEGQSNATMEAAAAGAPLVLSDIPAHRETFGDDAAYFPVGDAAALAAAILCDLANPKAAATRAARAQAAMQRLTIDETARRHRAFFDTLLESA